MPEIELVYFNARGRAEAIRLLLAEVGSEYKDTRFRQGPDALEDFNQMKEKGLLPFDQVPVLRIGDLWLAQSQAILRHLARLHGLDGKSSEESGRADMIVCAVDDLRQRFVSALASDNVIREAKGLRSPISQSLPEDFTSTTLPRWFQYFEKVMEAHGGNHVAGDNFTYADISLCDFLDVLLNCAPDCLADFPKLKSLLDAFRNRPKIKEWLEMRPETVV